MANYHVSKDKQTKDWNIQKEGGKNSSGSANTQKEAEKLQKDMQQTPVEVKSGSTV